MLLLVADSHFFYSLNRNHHFTLITDQNALIRINVMDFLSQCMQETDAEDDDDDDDTCIEEPPSHIR